jgi:hypothetical protein
MLLGYHLSASSFFSEEKGQGKVLLLLYYVLLQYSITSESLVANVSLLSRHHWIEDFFNSQENYQLSSL